MPSGQSIPVKPPYPAFRTKTSSFGVDKSSFLDSCCTDRRDVRSRISGRNEMRPSESALNLAALLRR